MIQNILRWIEKKAENKTIKNYKWLIKHKKKLSMLINIQRNKI